MAESSDAFLDAVASGDTEMIMRLLGGPILEARPKDVVVSEEEPAEVVELGTERGRDRGKYSVENGTEEVGSEVEDRLNGDEADEKVMALREEFEMLGGGAVDALLAVHGGQIGPTRAALMCLRDAEGMTGFDLEGYSAAVAAWNKDFPSLGNEDRNMTLEPVSAQESELVVKLRLDKLVRLFPWVEVAILKTVLQTVDGSMSTAEEFLRKNHPKPAGWSTVSMVKESEGEKSRESSSEVREARGVESWVATGNSVAAIYEQYRAEAADLARLRNMCFEQAAAASIGGNGNSARSLAQRGRDYNAQMKEKHQLAADAIFAARNPPGSKHIDLHGLHVSEALEKLEDVLSSLEPGSVRQILTGSGHHSRGIHNAPRLRPAVERFLREGKYNYQKIADSNKHVGAFRVYS